MLCILTTPVEKESCHTWWSWYKAFFRLTYATVTPGFKLGLLQVGPDSGRGGSALRQSTSPENVSLRSRTTLDRWQREGLSPNSSPRKYHSGAVAPGGAFCQVYLSSPGNSEAPSPAGSERLIVSARAGVNLSSDMAHGYPWQFHSQYFQSSLTRLKTPHSTKDSYTLFK